MSSAPAAAFPGPPILIGKDLEKTYEMGDRGLKVLRGVSVEVRKGEILAIQGPSGAGKSTLLHLLGLLDEPDQGEVIYHGENILAKGPAARAHYRNRRIGFVFQFYHLFPDLTALENVCLPRMVEKSWTAYHAEKTEIESRARHLLELVGLTPRLSHRPNELSGGERQRVAIARALMNEPEVLLCDEPTGNLDQKTAGEILDLLWRLNRENGQTFVIVTHDETLARRADRVVRVVDGVLANAEGAPSKSRGFAETKFRLRKDATGRTFRFPPAAAALLGLLGPLAIVVSMLANARFRRASGRGVSALGTFVGYVVPFFNLVWAFWAHFAPLRDADRLLAKNEVRPLIGRIAAPFTLWLAQMAMLGTFIAMRAGLYPGAESIEDVPVLAAFGVACFLQGAALGWIQSLHNAFYDRMSAQHADGTR